MVSYYEQHLITPKLLGGKGIMASVITVLVPCSALPCAAGQVLVCKTQVHLPPLLSAPPSRSSATCIYATCQQLGGTGIRLHFCTLSQQKSFSSQQNNHTGENHGPSHVSGVSGYKERCGQRGEFCRGRRCCNHKMEAFSMSCAIFCCSLPMK